MARTRGLIELSPNIVTLLAFCVKLKEWDFRQG